MLAVLKHYIENPEDIPPIPAGASEFLKVRLNPAYLISTGVLDELRKAGMSEASILGFIEGVNAAVEVVELMEAAQVQRMEDEQIT